MEYAGPAGRPLGPVLPWLRRSLGVSRRILGPAFLLTAAAELVVWLPLRLALRPAPPWSVEVLAQFLRVVLVQSAGAVVVHRAMAAHLGLRAGFGRAARRVGLRRGPVLAVSAVFAAIGVVQSQLIRFTITHDPTVVGLLSVLTALVAAVVTVPISLALVAAVVGRPGTNPFAASWRLAGSRLGALAGRILTLLVLSTLATGIAGTALALALIPLLEGASGGSPWSFATAFVGANLLGGAALLVVTWVATAELYLAAGGAGEL